MGVEASVAVKVEPLEKPLHLPREKLLLTDTPRVSPSILFQHAWVCPRRVSAASRTFWRVREGSGEWGNVLESGRTPGQFKYNYFAEM